jgi:hypothetical protein
MDLRLPLLAGLASVMVASTVVAPAPAQASTCHVVVVCGHIDNDPSSSRNLLVTCNWGTSAIERLRNSVWVRPGFPANCRDADGYFIQSGWAAKQAMLGRWSKWRVGPQWVKINDLQGVDVLIIPVDRD